MKAFSALLALCVGNSPSPVNSPHKGQRRSAFVVFFDLRLNKRLSKQSRHWLCETPSHSLWRHCNVMTKVVLRRTRKYYFDKTDTHRLPRNKLISPYSRRTIEFWPHYGDATEMRTLTMTLNEEWTSFNRDYNVVILVCQRVSSLVNFLWLRACDSNNNVIIDMQ